MSELINGKEAKLVWANGEQLQISNTIVGEDFYDMDDSKTTLNIFDLDFYKFRLKPRTISINNIEVPACGNNYKPRTFMFVLNSLEPCEYSKIVLDESDEIPPYWWSTEDEIKQVVSALRSVFKGGV